MSESQSESTPESTGDTNVEADQVVVNQAPDGGGVDNNNDVPADSAPAEESAPEGDSDSSE